MLTFIPVSKTNTIKYIFRQFTYIVDIFLIFSFLGVKNVSLFLEETHYKHCGFN